MIFFLFSPLILSSLPSTLLLSFSLLIAGDVLQRDENTWKDSVDQSTLSQLEDMGARVQKEKRDRKRERERGRWILLNFVQHPLTPM